MKEVMGVRRYLLKCLDNCWDIFAEFKLSANSFELKLKF